MLQIRNEMKQNIDKLLLQLDKKELLSWKLWLVTCILGLVLVPIAGTCSWYNFMFFLMMTNLVISFVICFQKMRKRIILICFYCTMFLFLITRVFIPVLNGWVWWTNYSAGANITAVHLINLSIIFLMLGMLSVELFVKCRKQKKKKKKVKKWVKKKFLMQALRVVLIVCMFCFFVQEIDKLLFMQGRSYEEYYTLYQSRLPFILTFPAGCMTYFLCAFLALKPSKKESFIWLGLYVISAIPMLLIGVRNPIVLNCVFVFLYYFLRDSIRKPNEKKWIGKYEKRILIVLIPIMIVFLGAYNYIRNGTDVEMSPVEIVVDFCYKQGTTYDTILQGLVYQDELPNREGNIYTTGALQEEILYNSLGKILFDAEDIGSGNSEIRATKGKTLSHAISYVVMGERYLDGQGRGSSYIIENFLDFRYAGVMFFSIFLGIICAIIPHTFGKKWLATVISLVIITELFFTPRAESTAFLCFIVSYKFWLCILGSVILGKIWENIYKKKNVKSTV